MMDFIKRFIGWERDEPRLKLSPKGEALHHCANVRCTLRDYLKTKEDMNKYMQEILSLQSKDPIPCEEYYLHIQKRNEAWAKYDVVSSLFSTHCTILQTLVLRDETMEVKMDGKIYHVSHKPFPMGYGIDVKEIVDITRCKCGEVLLDITDPDILGREGQIWYVCPMILCGCDEAGHTSIYEEHATTK